MISKPYLYSPAGTGPAGATTATLDPLGMFQTILKNIIRFLSHNNNPWGFFLLGLSALIEYVFPPFPGDLITLFGAFLVTRYGWNLPLVFLSVLLGSAAGSMIDFYAGVWMGRRYREGRIFKKPQVREKMERVFQNFRHYGEAYVALNRFLPAVRALFFIAAGMAGLRPFRVLLFAMVSAVAWNGLIILAGYGVGSNWNRLQGIFRTYSVIVWIVFGGIGVGFVLYKIISRKR